MILMKQKRAIVLRKDDKNYRGDLEMLGMILKPLYFDDGGEIKAGCDDEHSVIILATCSDGRWAQIENEINKYEELKNNVWRHIHRRKRRP